MFASMCMKGVFDSADIPESRPPYV
jgi:hypothetical protein